MDFSFLHPAALWLLLLAPLLWLLPRRLRDVRHGAIRSLLLAVLVLAIAEPLWIGEDRQGHVVAIVDASPSADRTRTAGLVDGVRRAAGSARARFASVHISQDAAGGSQAASPLDAALLAGASLIPEGRPAALVLISDLKNTGPDPGASLAALRDRGLPVHVAPLQAADPRPRPYRLRHEGPIRTGRTANTVVELAGSGTVRRLAIEDGSSVLAESGPFEVDGRGFASMPFEPPRAGFLPARITAEWEDGASASIETVIPVEDALSVLRIAGRPLGGGSRIEELLGRGFRIQSKEGGTAAASDLAGKDVVLLDDCPAEMLGTELQQAIVRAVEDRGLGLIMAGGEGSFGPGGYDGSPVSRILPVEFVQKEEKKDPSTALAIILDTSGSMSGQRIVIAKEVARLAIRRLLPHDKVGIVEFYGNKRWAAPLQSAANAIAIQRALNRLDAGGGTVIMPAIEEAYYGLKNTQTRYKHVLILTDAGVESGAFEPLLRRMARDGICISTVLVGPDRHSEFLVQLAEWGNGRYYNASDRFNLPEVILKQPSTARLPAWKTGEHAVRNRGGSAFWDEALPEAIPPLHGYVEVEARPGARVLMEAGSESNPLLASWHYGLGRTTAFMTEIAGPGTSGWSDWTGYGPLLARILSFTATEEIRDFEFRIERREGLAILVAERRSPGHSVPEARIVPREGSPLSLRFEQRSPRTFEARIHAAADAELLIEAGGGDGKPPRRIASGGSPLATDELAAPPLPGTIFSETTGGQVWTSAIPSAIPLSADGGAIAGNSLRPVLILLAVLLFLLDLLWRRLHRRTGPEIAP